MPLLLHSLVSPLYSDPAWWVQRIVSSSAPFSPLTIDLNPQTPPGTPNRPLVHVPSPWGATPKLCPFLEVPPDATSGCHSGALPAMLPTKREAPLALLAFPGQTPLLGRSKTSSPDLWAPPSCLGPAAGSHPLPTRVKAGAGPTGGWGAVGPPVGWASGQHGGGDSSSGGGEGTDWAAPSRPSSAGPARPSKPRGGEGERDRRAGAGRWVTTAAAAGGGAGGAGGAEGQPRPRGGGAGGGGRAGGRGRGGDPSPAGPAPGDLDAPPPDGAGGARASGGQVHTCHGNKRAIGRARRRPSQSAAGAACCQATAMRPPSRAQTKGGSVRRRSPPPGPTPPRVAPPGLAPGPGDLLEPVTAAPGPCEVPRAESRGGAARRDAVGQGGSRAACSLSPTPPHPGRRAALPEGAGQGTRAARGASPSSDLARWLAGGSAGRAEPGPDYPVMPPARWRPQQTGPPGAGSAPAPPTAANPRDARTPLCACANPRGRAPLRSEPPGPPRRGNPARGCAKDGACAG